MSNLQHYDNDDFELVIDTETGESFTTVSGYARMVGTINDSTPTLEGTVDPNIIKTAEIPTAGGFKKVLLIPEQLIATWVVRDNPELAVRMLLLGVRGYLHSLVNFTLDSLIG